MKTPLSQAQLEQFRIALVNERAQLARSEKDAVQTNPDRMELKTSAPNNSDEHSAAQSLPMAIALEGHVLESIASIDLALSRIESNQYGVCVDCDKPIAGKRLLAFPAAARCLSCKIKFEAKN